MPMAQYCTVIQCFSLCASRPRWTQFDPPRDPRAPRARDVDQGALVVVHLHGCSPALGIYGSQAVVPSRLI